MATKTVILTDAELCVDELGCLNALIVNNMDAPLYDSARAGIDPYADGVIEIKAGASRGLPDTNGMVYLLGNSGSSEITGTSAGVNLSAPSSPSEGSGVTRAEVNKIVTDKVASVVANAPEDFDTFREISDILAEQQTQNSDITTLRYFLGGNIYSSPSSIDNKGLYFLCNLPTNMRNTPHLENISYKVYDSKTKGDVLVSFSDFTLEIINLNNYVNAVYLGLLKATPHKALADQ